MLFLSVNLMFYHFISSYLLFKSIIYNLSLNAFNFHTFVRSFKRNKRQN